MKRNGGSNSTVNTMAVLIKHQHSQKESLEVPQGISWVWKRQTCKYTVLLCSQLLMTACKVVAAKAASQ